MALVPMRISINNLGKKFGAEWIFRNLSCGIGSGDKLVILGGNGSGKSTLLQVISGFVSNSEGTIDYFLNNQDQPENSKAIKADQLKNCISFASPYLQLIEDFTLQEVIEHSKTFKPFINKLSTQQFIEIIGLGHAEKKLIRQFSSGMKQRVKLGLAILSDTSLLLLDEPVSNLDREGIEWYKKLISEHTANRTVIVCSNKIEQEYFFCDKQLNVMDYKSRVKSTLK